jgi:hypothetical protein
LSACYPNPELEKACSEISAEFDGDVLEYDRQIRSMLNERTKPAL